MMVLWFYGYAVIVLVFSILMSVRDSRLQTGHDAGLLLDFTMAIVFSVMVLGGPILGAIVGHRAGFKEAERQSQPLYGPQIPTDVKKK